MSKPRRIIPGTTYLVTRRCSERRFLLRPDRYVVDTFLYCLAYAANKHDILIHAFNALTNHEHLQPSDPKGNLPLFSELFHGLLARALNAYRGRWESFFAPGSYSAQPLTSTHDVLDKIVYILTNPVQAGLVAYSRKWKGASSRKWRFGETQIIRRPVGPFFDPNGRLPESVPLTLTAPPLGLSNEEADRVVRDAVTRKETEIRAYFRSKGRSFLGMDQVMRVDPEDRPTSREPRRNLHPHVAGKDAEQRVAAIAELREFRAAYRDAWLQWRDGDREAAVFPYGTWLMRVRHRARCRPPPPS